MNQVRDRHEAAGPGVWRELTMSFETALARLPEALQREGFGVITEIDLAATFQAKLGASFRRYKIFGACNPKFAFDAVSHDLHVGLLLPCNVVVYEGDDGRAVVGAVDPISTLGAHGASTTLTETAREVGARLERALANLEVAEPR